MFHTNTPAFRAIGCADTPFFPAYLPAVDTAFICFSCLIHRFFSRELHQMKSYLLKSYPLICSLVFLSSACLLTSCSKKESSLPLETPPTDTAANNAVPNSEIHTQEPDQNPHQDNKQIQADAPTEPETSPTRDENPTEDEDADFEYKNLAINPDDCTVVYCKNMPGADSDLECNTKAIVDAGFFLGATVYRVGQVERATKFCVHRDTIYDKCFLDKESYQAYIRENKMDCAFDGSIDSKECINESPCIPAGDDESDDE